MEGDNIRVLLQELLVSNNALREEVRQLREENTARRAHEAKQNDGAGAPNVSGEASTTDSRVERSEEAEAGRSFGKRETVSTLGSLI